MKTCFFLLLIAVLLTARTGAQEIEIKRDNGQSVGAYFNAPSFFEESVILKPDGPCKVLEIRVYYLGNNPGKDTLMICGDPAEGAIPATAWVWHYNTLTSPVIVDYPGTAGWYNIDLRDRDLRLDGYDRIVIQHRLQKEVGPWFSVDNSQQQKPWASFTMDPNQTNSLGGPGVYNLVQNNYMVRLLVEYDYPDGNTSQDPPPATLIDVSAQAGIRNGDGAIIKASIAAVADWNNDGWDDISIGSNYLQNNGDGTYEYLPSSMGLPGGYAVWGDFDNDGLVDAYVVSGGDNDKLCRNNGDGTFSDVMATSGLSNPYPTVTPIWMDYNNDGLLDLFIANGRRSVSGNEVYYPDQLWRNDGNGLFTNVTNTSGIAAGEPSPYYDCWGASACDYNNDGYTDIFVSTYRLAPDLLYRNNKNGTFTEVGSQTGTRGVPTAAAGYFGHGMGSDWGDFDNDGWSDLIVGNLGHPDWRGMYSNPSLIFNNNRGQDFSELHQDMGLKFFEMNAGVTWADLNHDGWLDVWQSQYSYRSAGDQGEPERLSRVYLGDGPPSFKLKDRTWHLGSKIHGAWTVSRLDYDNDGDIDLLVASPHDGVRLFRNDIGKTGRSLGLRLTGDADAHVSAQAFGTRVVVHADGRQFTRTLSTSAAGSRAATNSTELHFGLGNIVSIDSVVVHYPNGNTNLYDNLQPDKKYTLKYDGGISTSTEANETLPRAWEISSARYGSGQLILALSGDRILQDVTVEVYDFLGRSIERLRAGRLSPGLHQFPLTGILSAGNYFVVVHATGVRNTARFNVLR